MKCLLDMKSNWNSLNIDDFLSVFASLHENMPELKNLYNVLEKEHLNNFLKSVYPELSKIPERLENLLPFFLSGDDIKKEKEDDIKKDNKKEKAKIPGSSLFDDSSEEEIEMIYKMMSVFVSNQSLEGRKRLGDKNEYSYLISLKYFYTTEPFVFADHMVNHFNNLHSKTSIKGNDLGSLLSMFSREPNLKGAKKLLNEPIHSLKLILFIRDLLLESEKALVVQRIIKSETKFLVKLCKSLKLDYNELTYFLKFLFCSLKLTEIPGFLRTFGFEKSIKIELMMSLMSFFPLNEEDFPDQKCLVDQLIRSTGSRSYLYNLFKIEEPEFFNLIYDLNQGNFWNICIF